MPFLLLRFASNPMMVTSKFLVVLLALLLAVALFIFVSVLLMPRNLVKSRVCSVPFQSTLFSEVCSSSASRTFNPQILALSDDTEYSRTLGVATSIYVVSLARRTDRRRIMDLLKEALELDWVYFDALDKDNFIVDTILNSVANQRMDSSLPSTTATTEFSWPNTLEEARLDTLGVENHDYGALRFRHISTDSLVCATEDDTVPTYEANFSIPFHMKLSRGMVACWYSHVKLMADIVKRTAHITRKRWDGREGVSVVFEDDVDVEWDLKERVVGMWRDLPRDWDIVMLGHCWSNESTHPPITPTSPLHPSYKPKCTHGYVLSPFGARNLLRHLTYPPFAFSRALDQAIAHLIFTGRVRSYSVVPSVVVQRRCPLSVDNSTSEMDYGSDTDSTGNGNGIGTDGDEGKENITEENENATICRYFGMDEDGDSDIWVSEGKKGSRWRDSLVDSTLARIWYTESELDSDV